MDNVTNFRSFNEDALDALLEIPDNTYSAVLTDPPYGLSGDPDMEIVLEHWLKFEDYSGDGKGFMGNDWDSFVPGPIIWRELYRTCKPGAIMLVYSGTRTADLMGVSIRLGGWKKFDEVSVYGGLDQLEWIYSTAMPKSANISRQADKLGDSESARTWDGYGTALNPAHEVIMLFRKDREGTFLENAIKHGTGVINIDGISIPTFGADKEKHLGEWDRMQSAAAANSVAASPYLDIDLSPYAKDGRFPKNLIFNEWTGKLVEVVLSPTQLLDAQTEHSKSKRAHRGAGIDGNTFKAPEYESTIRGHNDEGSKSRFFYVNKSSTRERGAGLSERNTHPSVKPISLSKYLATFALPPTPYRDDAVLAVPFSGTGSEAIGAMLAGWKNVDMFEREESYVDIACKRITWWWHAMKELQTTDVKTILDSAKE